MRVESSYPAPIYGVSTLAPRNRMKGHAGAQVNFRSDPINKLTRRPPLQWKGVLTTVSGDVLHHSYERDGSLFRFILDKTTGEVHTWVDGVAKSVIPAPVGYMGDNMVAQTVEDHTYFLNKDKTVSMLTTTDDSTIQKYSHLNVTTALNYSETVTVNVTRSNGTRYSVSHTVPALGIENPDYDAADAARATKQVASQLASKLNALSNIGAASLGSAVSVWDSTGNWLDLEVESGQGDRSVKAVNRVIESVTGLPLFAKVGTRITVKPDPTSNDGTYYLEATRSSDVATGLVLEEVVWTESRSPTEPYAFDNTTLPFIVSYDGSDFTLNTNGFKEREAGDDESNPVPEFVNNTIENISYFQKRLVLVTGNYVLMSEAKELDNFWIKSAVQLLVTDTVAVASSATGVDKLKHVIPHNRDLLAISSNSQFKIGGSEGITPQTIAMALTTRYDCQIDVAPVSMGNSVFLPIDYGTSTGIQEYTGERNTSQDVARPITHHVIGYMMGKASLLTVSPNLEMMALKTTDSNTNQIFVYEQFTKEDGSKVQKAWGQWVFSSEDEILDLEFRNDSLTVVCKSGDNVVLKELRLYARVSVAASEVYLDDMLSLDTDGLTATIPTGYNTDNIIVVRGSGTEYELNKVQFTLDGNTITFAENIQAGKVYIGREFESKYRPTRPFKYDSEGMAVTTDKLRIGRFIVNMVDTNELKMRIVSDYYNATEHVFNSRILGGLLNKVGEIPVYSGDYVFPFSQDAALAEAEFICDNYLGCSIIGISWEGQYFQSKRRI